jgi:plastocyanin
MKTIFLLIAASTFSYCVLASTPKAGHSTVAIESMKFTPQEITVKAGDTVTWVNRDLVPHTVTSADGVIDSKAIPPGKSWTFRSKKTGKHPYSCIFHPVMSGSISVE